MTIKEYSMDEDEVETLVPDEEDVEVENQDEEEPEFDYGAAARDELVRAAVADDGVKVQEIFNELIVDALTDMVADRKIEVAQSLFGGKPKEEELPFDDEDEEFTEDEIDEDDFAELSDEDLEELISDLDDDDLGEEEEDEDV